MKNGTKFSHSAQFAAFIGMAIAGMIFLSSCSTGYRAPVKPPGGIFAAIKAPLTTEFHGTPCGSDLKKVSVSHTYYARDILLTFLDFGWDEAGIARIARNGGIEKVAFADDEALYVLGVFARFTINVYGN